MVQVAVFPYHTRAEPAYYIGKCSLKTEIQDLTIE